MRSEDRAGAPNAASVVDAVSAQHLPLAGRRVAITRAAGPGDDLVALLRTAGAEPLAFPCIAIAPPADAAALDAAIERLLAGAFDWLVFTSANAVRAVADAQCTMQNARARPDGAAATSVPATEAQHSALSTQHGAFQVAAVGPATADAARALLGLEPAVVPEAFVGEALAAAMGDVRGQRVLLLNSEIARPALAELLRQAGASVERVVAYRSVVGTGGADLPALLAAGAVDAITFASGSAVRGFAERVGAPGMQHARGTVIACIGAVTAQAAREQGLAPTVVASSSTLEALVEGLIAVLGPASAPR